MDGGDRASFDIPFKDSADFVEGAVSRDLASLK